MWLIDKKLWLGGLRIVDKKPKGLVSRKITRNYYLKEESVSNDINQTLMTFCVKIY